MRCSAALDNCIVQEVHSYAHTFSSFPPSLLPLLFVALSHYLMLEVMNLISSQPRSCRSAHQCCTWQKEALGCWYYYCYHCCVCLPPKHSFFNQRKCVIREITTNSAHKYSEVWPRSGGLDFHFVQTNCKPSGIKGGKQKSLEREKPLQI